MFIVPLKRLLLYIIILLTMCAFLNLMPQTKRIYTYIGQRTMFVYLLHGIVIESFAGLIYIHLRIRFLSLPIFIYLSVRV